MTKVLLLASAAIAGAALSVGAAQAQTPFDWNGFYAGIHGGILTGDVTVHEGGLSIAGGNIQGSVVGFLAGYSFSTTPLPPIRFGIEADFGWADVQGHGNACNEDCSVDYLYDLHWDAHARLIASAPMGNITPFVAAGLAWADLDITEENVRGGLFTGGTLGAGLDVKLGPSVILRGEILYDFYGRHQYSDFSADFNALTGRGALIWRLP